MNKEQKQRHLELTKEKELPIDDFIALKLSRLIYNKYRSLDDFVNSTMNEKFKTIITKQAISRWLNKKNSPTVKKLDMVCQALGITLADFFLDK